MTRAGVIRFRSVLNVLSHHVYDPIITDTLDRGSYLEGLFLCPKNGKSRKLTAVSLVRKMPLPNVSDKIPPSFKNGSIRVEQAA